MESIGNVLYIVVPPKPADDLSVHFVGLNKLRVNQPPSPADKRGIQEHMSLTVNRLKFSVITWLVK